MRLVDGDVSCVVEGDLRQGQQHWMYVAARVGGADNSLFYIKGLRFKVLSGSEQSRLGLPVFFFIITKCVKVLCGYSIQKGLNAILSCYFMIEDIHSCITKHTGSPDWLQLLTISACFLNLWLWYARTSLYTESYSACTTSMLLHEQKSNTILCCPQVNINLSCNINDIALPLM